MSKEQIRFAGTSRLNGELKFRTATTAGRVAQLERTDTEVSMLEIQPVATKAEAAKALLALDHMAGNAEITAVYVAKAQDENPFAKPKKARTVRIKATRADATDADRKLTPKEAARIREEFNAQVRAAYEAN